MAVAAKPVVRERRDVEDLVIWALVDNGLGEVFNERAGRFDMRDLGTRIDGVGRGWSGSGPSVKHEDAWHVAAVIGALPADEVTGEHVMAELIVRHGRTNCRPDWCEEGVGHFENKTNKRGQVEWHYERPGDRKSRKIAAKRIWVGETQANVDFYRARYALWWIALKEMVAPLNEVLEKYEATGPRAPEEPWAMGKVYGPDGEVLTGLHGNDPSGRLVRLARRGPIEMERPSGGTSAVEESASRGRTHGRS